jgi:hypothetical protein
MKAIVAPLILIGLGLLGCRTSADSTTHDVSATTDDDLVVWYRIPPIDRVSHMPLAKVSPSSVAVPTLPIGIPAWH